MIYGFASRLGLGDSVLLSVQVWSSKSLMQAREQQSRSFQGLDPVLFRDRGYTVVRGLFEAAEVQQLRSQVIETFAEMERQGRVGTDPGRDGTIRGLESDLLSIPSLRHVLLDPRILHAVGELLGGEPVYFGDSSVRIGGSGARAWHRDNVNRARGRGPDWRGSYPLLRCGLYLQDHALHSGGLALRPYSHESRRLLPTLPTHAASRAGELVAWNMRTVHTGEVVRLRGAPGLVLHPRVQSRLPTGLRVPEERDRIVLFMAFGLPSAHLDRYVGYLSAHHHMQRAWSGSRFGQKVWDEATRAGLHVLRPTPAYGTPADSARVGTRPRPARAHATQVREMQSLEAGGVGEDQVTAVLAAVREHPTVAEIAHSGYSLIEFAEPRLRAEIELLLRGWMLARIGALAPIHDPVAPVALLMGARAALGRDPAGVPYTLAAESSGSQLKRVLARQLMRAVAAVSDPKRVRVAAVVAGGLARALAALPAADLRTADVGVLPFPGLDRGGGTRFALRHRLPLLTGYGPRRPEPGMAVRLPESLALTPEPELDRALTLLVARTLTALAPVQDKAVKALGGLRHTYSLRVILLPDPTPGAARLLIAYARDRGLRVGVMDEGTCRLRRLGGDGPADVPRLSREEAAQNDPTRSRLGSVDDAAGFAEDLRVLGVS
jgi:hypothetical protein